MGAMSYNLAVAVYNFCPATDSEVECHFLKSVTCVNVATSCVTKSDKMLIRMVICKLKRKLFTWFGVLVIAVHFKSHILTDVNGWNGKGPCSLCHYQAVMKWRLMIVASRFSGITRKMLKHVHTRIEDVQQRLQQLLPNDAILIGHSLNFDLDALQVSILLSFIFCFWFVGFKKNCCCCLVVFSNCLIFFCWMKSVFSVI